MKTFITIMALLLIGSQALAKERKVECRIASNGAPTYKGKCLFISDKSGSFSLENPIKNKPLVGDSIVMVNVYIVDKGVAEVRGLTTAGINSRWGEAKRSSEDKACWVGEDFRICAW